MKLVTASNLWKDINYREIDLDVSVLNFCTVDDIDYLDAYFTAATFDSSSIRVRCSLVKRVEDVSPNVVVIMDDIDVDYNKTNIDKYLDAGFAVFRFDYLGQCDNIDSHTIYPQQLDFCNYYLHNNEMSKVVNTPQESCWYYWSLVAYRSIIMVEWLCNFVPNYLNNEIALVGVGVGGAHAIKTVVQFDNIKSLIIKYDADSYIDNSEQENIVSNVSFSSGSYTPFIDIPVLLELCSNESDNSFDNMVELYQTIGVDISSYIIFKRLAISNSRSHKIGPNQALNEILWINHTMRTQDYHIQVPLSPKLTAKLSQGKVYFEMMVDYSFDIEQVQIFVASDQLSHQSPPAYRYWAQSKVDNIGDGEYLLRLDGVSGHVFRAFGTVTYANGYSISTLVEQVVIPSSLDSPQIQSERLIYDSDMGVDSWMATSRDTSKGDVVMSQGPFEIAGVSGLDGELANFKIGALKYRGQEGYILQISMYSGVDQGVLFGVTDMNNQFFNHVLQVIGSNTWNKVNLAETDFKGVGKLDWSQVVSIVIRSEYPILVSCMLWL
jgi:hypothetical protein